MNTPVRIVVHGLGAFSLLVFAGCTSVALHRSAQSTGAVRRVVFMEVPELRSWAERAQQVGDDAYPKLVAMLTDNPGEAPREIDIVFKKTLPEDNRGVAFRKTVHLNAALFFSETNGVGSYLSEPANFDKVLVHELAHIAATRSVLRYSKKSPGHWVEGLADYGRYKLGYTNGWSCPECGTNYPHYTSGYSCAGAFLLHVDSRFGSNVIRQLASALRHGSYSDEFFARRTGRSLEELWTEFKGTPAYLPVAEETHQLHQALGYVRGRPPKDLQKQVMSYLKSRPGGVLTLEAGNFLQKLVAQDQLPGATEAERKQRRFTLSVETRELLRADESKDFPMSRRFYGRLEGDASRLYYVVGRAAKEAPWKLQKAWRADEQGRRIEDFPIPD